MSTAHMVGRPAHELLVRKLMREGWLLAVVALLIPFFGLWAAVQGARAWGLSRQPAAIALMATGIAVFVVRLALYVL